MLYLNLLSKSSSQYRINSTYSDRRAWENSVDPYQNAASDQGLHCLPADNKIDVFRFDDKNGKKSRVRILKLNTMINYSKKERPHVSSSLFETPYRRII